MTASHMSTAPTAPPAIPPALTDWLDLSRAMTAEAPAIADRDDLIVVIAPGAASGNLAMFLPLRGVIAIEGANLGIDPGTARPWRYADRQRYAPTWGALTHECAHAAHTRWTPPPGTGPEIAHAALLMEESRIEAAQVRRRPEDRHWLRASTRQLVFAETGGELATARLAPTRYAAAHTAALMLARIDAGVLDAGECAPTAAAIEEILGRDILRQLRSLWRIAHRLSDTNTYGMLELGRRWFALIGPAPHTTPQPDSPLGQAVTGSLTGIATSVDAQEFPPDPADLADREASDKAEQQDRAAATSRKVFNGQPVRGRTRAP
ncbi:hypothetical protein ACFWFG_37875, partial [Streptomyces roseolus]